LIAIGLDNAVYTWNAKTNEAHKLTEFQNNLITSLNWNPRSVLLATGDDRGDIRIFDVEKNKCARTFENHSYRVGTLSWNGSNILTSGSRDSKIYISDLRNNKPYVCKF
jgi:WD40 repeat protein